MTEARNQARREWFGQSRRWLGGGGAQRLEQAGALGLLTGHWSNGWGVDKIFSSQTREIPSVHLSCEDYSLVFRLAERDQGPRIRLNADAELLGDVPAFNVVATIPGTAFAADNPEVVEGLQAAFNQDNGTWRIDYIRLQGFPGDDLRNNATLAAMLAYAASEDPERVDVTQWCCRSTHGWVTGDVAAVPSAAEERGGVVPLRSPAAFPGPRLPPATPRSPPTTPPVSRSADSASRGP